MHLIIAIMLTVMSKIPMSNPKVMSASHRLSSELGRQFMRLKLIIISENMESKTSGLTERISLTLRR